MKKLIMLLCFATMVLFGVSSEVLDSKYFKYDLAGEQILNTTGLKGDYICITEIDNDKLKADGISEIEFPKEIEGLKVIAICGTVGEFGEFYNVFIGNNIKKVIIPETYEVVSYSSNKCPETQFTGTTTRPLYFGIKPYASYDDIKGNAEINGGLPQAGRKVYFPQSVTFYDSTIKINGIKTLTVSKNWIFDCKVQSSNGYSFVESDSIEELKFEEGCVNVCRWKSEKLTKLTLAKSIKEIVADAFLGNSSLTEVIIPDGSKYSYPDCWTKSIWKSMAFNGCSLNIKTKSAIRATGYDGEF